MLKSSRDIKRRLEAEGWQLVRIKGSHHQFKRGEVTITLPHPRKDLPIGLVISVYKMAGWKRD